jgi:hypothetical protein
MFSVIFTFEFKPILKIILKTLFQSEFHRKRPDLDLNLSVIVYPKVFNASRFRIRNYYFFIFLYKNLDFSSFLTSHKLVTISLKTDVNEPTVSGEQKKNLFLVGILNLG